MFEKLEDELTAGTLSAAAGRWLAEGKKDLKAVWSYGFLPVGDRLITLGQLIEGLALFLIGILVSRWLSRAFGRRLLSRVGVNASATAAFQSLAFYLLMVVFALFALKLIDVPLTAFTVLGGAVALGIGFGSQNIVNNFISGLILLAERPVKVGDLIQIEQHLRQRRAHRRPQHRGSRRATTSTSSCPTARSSRPTSSTGRSRTTTCGRTCAFGVVYGSPTGKVTHLALKAAANHDRVFDRPAPFVIFNDFGDNALEFELHFWVSVRTLMERRQIESDIRFNIDHLFREAGIVIAFPQRDVHLFTEQPLRVQMAAAEQEETRSA